MDNDERELSSDIGDAEKGARSLYDKGRGIYDDVKNIKDALEKMDEGGKPSHFEAEKGADSAGNKGTSQHSLSDDKNRPNGQEQSAGGRKDEKNGKDGDRKKEKDKEKDKEQDKNNRKKQAENDSKRYTSTMKEEGAKAAKSKAEKKAAEEASKKAGEQIGAKVGTAVSPGLGTVIGAVAGRMAKFILKLIPFLIFLPLILILLLVTLLFFTAASSVMALQNVGADIEHFFVCLFDIDVNKADDQLLYGYQQIMDVEKDKYEEFNKYIEELWKGKGYDHVEIKDPRLTTEGLNGYSLDMLAAYTVYADQNNRDLYGTYIKAADQPEKTKKLLEEIRDNTTNSTVKWQLSQMIRADNDKLSEVLRNRAESLELNPTVFDGTYCYNKTWMNEAFAMMNEAEKAETYYAATTKTVRLPKIDGEKYTKEGRQKYEQDVINDIGLPYFESQVELEDVVVDIPSKTDAVITVKRYTIDRFLSRPDTTEDMRQDYELYIETNYMASAEMDRIEYESSESGSWWSRTWNNVVYSDTEITAKYGNRVGKTAIGAVKYAIEKGLGCRYTQNLEPYGSYDPTCPLTRWSNGVFKDDRAYDCSSLVYRAYQDAGETIFNGYSTANKIAERLIQLSNQGNKRIVVMSGQYARENPNVLLPGDMIFYWAAEYRKANVNSLTGQLKPGAKERYLDHWHGIDHVALYYMTDDSNTHWIVEAKGKKFGVVTSEYETRRFNDIAYVIRILD